MDPYYFLDLRLTETDEDEQLHDRIGESPWGHWDLDVTEMEARIIYKDECYSRITFDNDEKMFTFYKEDIVSKRFKLTLVEM